MHDICSLTTTCSIFAIVGIVLALFALFSAWWVTREGLTYSFFAATLWLLIFVSGGRIVHVAFELWHLDLLYGDDLFYLVEIAFYMIGLVAFTGLLVDSWGVRDPRDVRKRKEG